MSQVTLSELSPQVQEQLRPRWKGFLTNSGAAMVVAVLLAIAYKPAEVFLWPTLFTDANNMLIYGRDFMRPDFTELDFYLIKMLETIYIAIWGTFLSIIFGVPCCLLASRNIAPWWIVQPMRRLMDTTRAINEIVFAILFVAAVGLGPFAGVMALFIHNLGVISKLFSEAVEAIDSRPVEGIHSTGAKRIQEIAYGVIPQVLPLWTSLMLYRFETNVRSATVLGIVGAGGIGFTFFETFRSFEHGQTSAIIIVVVVSVMLIDVVSAQLRKFLL